MRTSPPYWRTAATLASGAPVGHHEHGPRAGRAGRPGDRLRVVAGARRDHPGAQLGLGQPADHVGRAARLERARDLEVLGLQRHPRAHPAGQLARAASVGVSRTRPAIGRAASRGRARRAPSRLPPCRTATVRIIRTWPRGRRRPGCSPAPRCSAAWSARAGRRSRQVAVPRSWDRGRGHLPRGRHRRHLLPVRTGAVLLTARAPGRPHVALAELRAGALFGELAMFRGETRSATAEAIEPTTRGRAAGRRHPRLIRRNPDMALKLLATLAERVQPHQRAPARSSRSRRWPAASPACCSRRR